MNRRTIALGFAALAAAATLCCSSPGGRGAAHAAADERPRQARLTFELSEAQPGDKAAAPSGATLLVPVSRGGGSYGGWGKLSSDVRGVPETPAGSASAVWTERGVATTRVVARARLLDGGALSIGYAVEALEDGGASPTPVAAGAVAAPRVMSGPSLEGEALLPSKGGTTVLGAIHDARGHRFEVKVTAEVATVE